MSTPAHKIRRGVLQVTIWRNKTEKGTYYSVNISRGYSLVEKCRERLDQLWQRFGGTGPNPLTRSSYKEFGHDDDAMLVDQALYDHFLKPLAGTATCLDDESPHRFADLDGDLLDETFIDRKWLVVVDYHN